MASGVFAPLRHQSARIVRFSGASTSSSSSGGSGHGAFGIPQARCVMCRHRVPQATRSFSSSSRRAFSDPKTSGNTNRGPFRARLRTALRETKIQWYTIPVSVGIGFLGGLHFYKTTQREKRRIEQEEAEAEDEQNGRRPPRRARVKPTGPWAVQISYYLPLKLMSRAWGWFNSCDIPYYVRPMGFRLYSWIFGVNLSEMEEQDLYKYPNLASFFYRTLKPGVRPLDERQNAILSPADGRVLQFGVIEHGKVEQVKGMTYSLEALLGTASPSLSGAPENIEIKSSTVRDGEHAHRDSLETIRADEEFANVNGISYTLANVQSQDKTQHSKDAKAEAAAAANAKAKAKMVTGSENTDPKLYGESGGVYDASTTPKSGSVAEVRADLALSRGTGSSWWPFGGEKDPTALYYCVIYLAPGDYHRFHSPVSWVVEQRRHFAGELYSVSPYLQRTLPGLFTLNERVVLLGRWRWGFFSYIPVGATNVGSIKINFDAELRTNSLTTDTAADRAAERAARRGEHYAGFAEATYRGASSVLGGHALRRGEEMGGFQLGSTIVLVFEAPLGRRPSLDEGWRGDAQLLKGGWRWGISNGQKVKVGQALGWVDEE